MLFFKVTVLGMGQSYTKGGRVFCKFHNFKCADGQAARDSARRLRHVCLCFGKA